jgi:hypothetical protein
LRLPLIHSPALSGLPPRSELGTTQLAPLRCGFWLTLAFLVAQARLPAGGQGGHVPGVTAREVG